MKFRDSRLTESADDATDRLQRAVRADILWWAENARVIPDPAVRARALAMARGLEQLQVTVFGNHRRERGE